MKYLFALCFLVFGMLSATSQADEASSVLTVKIPATTLKHSLEFQEIEIPLVSNSTTEDTIDIKAENWDTTVYNPYKETTVSFPFELKFDDTTYHSPVRRNKVVTSRYGWRRGRAHKGIDIDLVTGDSVFSILEGVIRFARYSGGHGRTVVVRHFNGLETTYAHLSKIGVKVNDTVTKGQFIGKGGNTGRSFGSHLHLETRYKGQYIHPEYLFDFNDTNAIRSTDIWITKKWTRPGYHSARRQSKLALYSTKDEALEAIEAQRKIYVVKRGDTLSRISQRNNVSIASICEMNAIRRNSTLRIGQKLVIQP